MRTKKVYIKGMHCVSCEKLLNDELKNVSRVKAVKANRKTCEVEIDYKKKEPSFSEIEKIAKKFGYVAFENKPGSDENISEKADWTEWAQAVLIVVIILFLYRIFKNFGILDKINLKWIGNKLRNFIFDRIGCFNFILSGGCRSSCDSLRGKI